ncbi:MAG: ATP-dependent Clp protease proteolytic subunit [Bacilli bacterium]|nr:ATP-dependent Clp protease proteolytic subunit [Bacilli bacterium]
MKNLFENNHVFYFYNDVNDSNVKTLIDDITKTVIEDEKAIINNNNELISNNIDIKNIKYELPHIIIHLNTSGGSVYDAMALFDFIETLKKKYVVEIICQGHVMSAGTLILQAASIRKSYKNTSYMIHGMSSWVGGMIADFEESIDHIKYLQDTYINIIENKTKLLADDLKNKFQNKENWFFNTKTALEIGLIDEIIE